MNTNEVLRHFLAALAYRLQKAIRGAPEKYWAFEPGQGVRTPRQIVRHINGVLNYGLAVLRTRALDPWIHLEDLDWKGEVERIHATLEALDAELARRGDLPDGLLLRLLQGPLADAMTHVGQLATLRRLAGSPVRGENFIKARIRAGQLGPDQPARTKRRLRI